MTADLDARFAAAAEASKTLPARPDNDTLLKLYSLYKQATVGDVEGSRPGFMDPVGRAKYDAWEKLEGMSADDAKAKYAELVEGLAG
jgi:acyl-CoA-binding protein